MTDTPSRMFSLLCVLVGVWVVAYWLYEPSGQRTTVDDRPPAASPDPATATPAAPRPAQADRSPTPQPPEIPVPARPEDVTSHEPQGPPPPPAPPKTRKVVLEPKFTEYVVQRGDTGFQGIAKRVYNDSSKWQAISRANPYVTPDRLKPGVTKLRIPVDPENIQGKVIEVPVDAVGPTPPSDPESSPHPDPAPPPKPEPEPEPAERTYTVRDGDTLWGIAQEVYGRGAQWKRIYDANRGVIRDPDELPKPGTVLKIPPPPV